MIDFKGHRIEKAIILTCVRWYLAYPLSDRNLEEMMAERGVTIDHSNIYRWVQKFTPKLEAVFRKGNKHPVGKSWRADETYIKIKGQWRYLYRAVDKEGQTIDFLLTARRDKQAALRFFRKAIQRNSKRIEQNRRKAGFPLHKHLEESDYRFQTTISKREVSNLLDFGFIDNHDNVIFIGPPGVGKTHLAIGISLKAIEAGYKVSFHTALGLMETLELAELKGELKKKINQLKFDCLIISELDYLTVNK